MNVQDEYRNILNGVIDKLRGMASAGISELPFVEDEAATRTFASEPFPAGGKPLRLLVLSLTSGVDGASLSEEGAELLDKMVGAMKVEHRDIRVITDAEDLGVLCELRPEAVVAFGAEACEVVLGSGVDFASACGSLFERGGVNVMVTRHPSELLGDPSLKALVWRDLKKVMGLLGISA